MGEYYFFDPPITLNAGDTLHMKFDKDGNLTVEKHTDCDELILPDGKRISYLGGLVKDEHETLETD